MLWELLLLERVGCVCIFLKESSLVPSPFPLEEILDHTVVGRRFAVASPAPSPSSCRGVISPTPWCLSQSPSVPWRCSCWCLCCALCNISRLPDRLSEAESRT